jgi:hypothetical protein
MQVLSEDGRQLVEAVARRHGVSSDAAQHLLLALAAGGGKQAQFNHPDLGGMGQWSQGGMIMVGDMFNHGLKARVDALCNDLAAALQNSSPFAPAMVASQSQSQSGNVAGVSLFVGQMSGNRWPAELGTPSSVGSQNDLHYAVFPARRRLAIEQGGRVTVYDTGDHQIGGFSQQQSGGQSLTFTSQHGLVRLLELPVVPSGSQAVPDPKSSASSATEPVSPPVRGPAVGSADDAIFSRIERLAELRKKDIITAEEFDTKKAELLARL